LGNNINSNNFLKVLIAGVKLTPRVKYVSKCEGNRRVNHISVYGDSYNYFQLSWLRENIVIVKMCSSVVSFLNVFPIYLLFSVCLTVDDSDGSWNTQLTLSSSPPYIIDSISNNVGWITITFGAEHPWSPQQLESTDLLTFPLHH